MNQKDKIWINETTAKGVFEMDEKESGVTFWCGGFFVMDAIGHGLRSMTIYLCQLYRYNI